MTADTVRLVRGTLVEYRDPGSGEVELGVYSRPSRSNPTEYAFVAYGQHGLHGSAALTGVRYLTAVRGAVCGLADPITGAHHDNTATTPVRSHEGLFMFEARPEELHDHYYDGCRGTD